MFIDKKIEERLLTAFQHAARTVPAYQHLLKENGVKVNEIVNMDSFFRFCPLLNKQNTFVRFPLKKLCTGW